MMTKSIDEARFNQPQVHRSTAPAGRERSELVVGVTRGLPAFPHQKPVDCEAVLAAFNTWSFKREQPDDREKLVALIAKAAAANRPVSFVLYWGKGPRETACQHEAACLAYLKSMQDRIKKVYAPGADITLIFTDSHAALNGYQTLSYARYFRSVQQMLPDARFETCHLASLVRDARPLLADEHLTDQEPSDALLQSLVTSANKWYKGGGDAAEGARAYFKANMIERRAVELAFPDSVFVTFNGSEVRDLFPTRMPIFYMYSLKKGFAVKPWFMD